MIINGDSLTILKTIDTNSIDMCITSPPYYKLRDYGIKKQSSHSQERSNICSPFSLKKCNYAPNK